MSRATRAYVSKYDLSQVHQSSLFRFRKQRYYANFNGAMDPERVIDCVTWYIDAPEIGVLSDAQLSEDRRETSVVFAAQLGGWATMRCEATLDDGDKINQVFRVNVREASWFGDDPPIQSGPFSVSVCYEPYVPTGLIMTTGTNEAGAGFWLQVSAGSIDGDINEFLPTGQTLTLRRCFLFGGDQLQLRILGSDSAPGPALFSQLEIYDMEFNLIATLNPGDAFYQEDGSESQWTWDPVPELWPFAVVQRLLSFTPFPS